MTNSQKLLDECDRRSTVLPQYLLDLLAGLPANVDRRYGAILVTKNFFPVSHRTLEGWPLPVRRVNGRAVTSTVKLFEVAYAKLTSAPVLMGGYREARE